MMCGQAEQLGTGDRADPFGAPEALPHAAIKGGFIGFQASFDSLLAFPCVGITPLTSGGNTFH